MGPVGEDSAAPRQGAYDPDAGWCTRVLFGFYREPKDHKRLELYDLETHQKKLGPDYHRLKSYGEEKYRARNSK